MLMDNRKKLAILYALRSVINVFKDAFLSIYLFKIVNGDFNFLLIYAAFISVSGIIFAYFIMRYINTKNASRIFQLSFVLEVICAALLLFTKENLVHVFWIFAFCSRLAKSCYSGVYETTLIKSNKHHSISSYIAGSFILSSLVTLLAPAIFGFIITDYSYIAAFAVLLVDAILAFILSTSVDFTVLDKSFRLKEFWKKAFKNKSIRQSYLVIFLKRLSGPDGIMNNIIPILLFNALGTEAGMGSYNTIFTVVFLVLLQILRIMNKKKIRKRFYIPFTLLGLISTIFMVISYSPLSILCFYFTIKTTTYIVMTEAASALYAIGIKEKLGSYTREHRFTWNIFLGLGNLVGVVIAYIIYNYFYSQTAFAIMAVALTFFSVVMAFFLQKLEDKLDNK